jgi:spore maturation protein CgeB
LSPPPLRIVVLGLSITSSWGNGHATTYRGLVRELVARGHDVLFLERDVPWYARHRDLASPWTGRIALYGSLDELQASYAGEVRDADLVIVGSYVPDGIAVGEWAIATAEGLTAFYDIDTPVTLARLAAGEVDYLSLDLIPRYEMYLSFTGGPTLQRLEREYGSPMARPLYCSFDPLLYRPAPTPARWTLGYMGTYSEDRQPGLEQLLLEPARRLASREFVVAGSQYPAASAWPPNVQHIDHLTPARHRDFYTAQRFTLNLTRADMIAAGYSPSVRLFEAAACGTPIISDYWPGLETFFEPGREILIARSAGDVLRYLRDLPEEERQAIAYRARRRALAGHTAARRAKELESYVLELRARRSAA